MLGRRTVSCILLALFAFALLVIAQDAPLVQKLGESDALKFQNLALRRALAKEQVQKLQAQQVAIASQLKDAQDFSEKVEEEFSSAWSGYAKKFQFDSRTMQYNAEKGEFSGTVVVPKDENKPKVPEK